MKTFPITKEDEQLIEEAKEVVRRYYRSGKHHIGAAIRTKSGKIFTAVNLEAYLRKVDVCAEVIALGRAIVEGEREFDTIVAVRHPYSYEQDQEIKVVAPCGMCREVIYDYGSRIKVIIPNKTLLEKIQISDLLPFKYKRR